MYIYALKMYMLFYKYIRCNHLGSFCIDCITDTPTVSTYGSKSFSFISLIFAFIFLFTKYTCFDRSNSICCRCLICIEWGKLFQHNAKGIPLYLCEHSYQTMKIVSTHYYKLHHLVFSLSEHLPNQYMNVIYYSNC